MCVFSNFRFQLTRHEIKTTARGAQGSDSSAKCPRNTFKLAAPIVEFLNVYAHKKRVFSFIYTVPLQNNSVFINLFNLFSLVGDLL